jgi:hypothetical protein
MSVSPCATGQKGSTETERATGSLGERDDAAAEAGGACRLSLVALGSQPHAQGVRAARLPSVACDRAAERALAEARRASAPPPPPAQRSRPTRIDPLKKGNLGGRGWGSLVRASLPPFCPPPVASSPVLSRRSPYAGGEHPSLSARARPGATATTSSSKSDSCARASAPLRRCRAIAALARPAGSSFLAAAACPVCAACCWVLTDGDHAAGIWEKRGGCRSILVCVEGERRRQEEGSPCSSLLPLPAEHSLSNKGEQRPPLAASHTQSASITATPTRTHTPTSDLRRDPRARVPRGAERQRCAPLAPALPPCERPPRHSRLPFHAPNARYRARARADL